MTPLSCDVVIVGAGIAGAILARRLAEAGVDVVVLEAGEAVGLTWEDYQANIRQFLAAPAKVPNAAWPNSPAAPSPNVLDIRSVQPGGPPDTAGYFVQMGPIPFGSDYSDSVILAEDSVLRLEPCTLQPEVQPAARGRNSGQKAEIEAILRETNGRVFASQTTTRAGSPHSTSRCAGGWRPRWAPGTSSSNRSS